jgi:hypothetical protein
MELAMLISQTLFKKMKTLSRLSLLGDIDLFSKVALKQLLGSSGKGC